MTTVPGGNHSHLLPTYFAVLGMADIFQGYGIDHMGTVSIPLQQ